jgi:hypothetical protein
MGSLLPSIGSLGVPLPLPFGAPFRGYKPGRQLDDPKSRRVFHAGSDPSVNVRTRAGNRSTISTIDCSPSGVRR